MLVIPVIDLMGGTVVHARHGERDTYAPLATSLCPSSDPLEVVDALLAQAPFGTLYVADLDAIRHTGDHLRVLRRIRERYPRLELWVDAGFGTAATLAPWLALDVTPVIGSESLTSMDALAEVLACCPQAILSLDSRGDARLGPPAIFERPAYWPATIIVMTLERVGAGAGPALETLGTVLAQAASRKVVAAGGVRCVEDLRQLATLGIHAVLLASALHDGRLSVRELAGYLQSVS